MSRNNTWMMLLTLPQKQKTLMFLLFKLLLIVLEFPIGASIAVQKDNPNKFPTERGLSREIKDQIQQKAKAGPAPQAKAAQTRRTHNSFLIFQ